MSQGGEAASDTKPARGRGRPRRFDLDAAMEVANGLFRARGYDRVTLSDLTAAMGINPPSFYAAFGNKALLFMRIADTYAQEWLVEVRAAFDELADMEEALGRIVLDAAGRFAWRETEIDDGWGGCMILEAASNCSDVAVVAQLRKARLSIATALYRGISRSTPDQVVALTDHVMTLLAGLSAMGRDGVGHERLISVARQAVCALSRSPAEA